MKERNIIIIKFFIVIVMVLTAFLALENNVSFAEDTNSSEDMSISEILSKGRDFISQGKESSTMNEEKITEIFVPVGRTLVVIATATVFIVTLIMGIKWITASPEQQAVLKKQLIGLVVSIIVIYGAVGIWTLIKTIMENLIA